MIEKIETKRVVPEQVVVVTTYKCTVCGATFGTRQEADQHMIEEERQLVSSAVLDKTTVEIGDYDTELLKFRSYLDFTVYANVFKIRYDHVTPENFEGWVAVMWEEEYHSSECFQYKTAYNISHVLRLMQIELDHHTKVVSLLKSLSESAPIVV
jgi:hypothetical protein